MISFRWLPGIFVATCLHSEAQSFKPVDEKSSISFAVKNFGLNVSGTLSHLQGTIAFDPQNLKSSHFAVSVESETLDTGIDLRDKHIKKEAYLDVARYSEITFKSTEITSDEKSGTYTVRGNLTIKATKQVIQFPFTAELTDNGIILKGKFKINRRDFNVGGKSISMNDTVDVSIQVFALKTTVLSTDSK